MPKSHRRARTKKVGRGKILDWIRSAASKVDGFLKKTKILSNVSSNFTSNPYGAAANTALNSLGYGRHRGSGGYSIGSGLKLAGTGRRKRRGRGVVLSGNGRLLM